jgi:hypothetical protein
MEVQALRLIWQRNTIPTPKVHAWGAASDNPLEFGPFIIMDFIQAVSLSDLVNDPAAERPTALIREDIGDDDVEIIYRQLANFSVETFELNVGRIGSLPSPEPGDTVPIRPLTSRHTLSSRTGASIYFWYR